MAGELFREQWQTGLESVYGTVVAATRKAYVMDASITREREARLRRVMTGTRDNQRAHTLGPVTVGGSARVDVSANELLEWLTILFGSAVVTTPAGATLARLHTFKPLATVPSLTLERNDGAQVKRATGIMANSLAVAGSVGGENTATFDLFGADYLNWAGPLTTLTDRIPTYLEGWQTNGYLEAIGGTAGTTQIANALINWAVTVGNNLGRKRFAMNSLLAQAVVMGQLDVTAKVTLEAAAAISTTEIANWEAQSNRLLRLEFLGPAEGIEAAVNEVQTLSAGGLTAGTFTLSFDGQVTAAIVYNAAASAVDSALEALSNIGVGDVVCTGGPLPGTPVVVTFGGTLAAMNVSPLVVNSTLLVNGSVAMAVTTPGSPAARETVTIDLPGAWAAVDFNATDEGTRVYGFDLNALYSTGLASAIVVRCITARTAAFA